MAIDSRATRFGLMGLAFPPLQVFPNPDGAVDTKGERYDYLWLYPGDLVTSVLPAVLHTLNRSLEPVRTLVSTESDRTNVAINEGS